MAEPVLSWDGLKRVRPLPAAAHALRWLVVALLCLAVLDVARVAGVPIVLLVLVWTGSALARGRKGAKSRRSGRAADRPPPRAAHPRPSAGTRRGNPYDVETYLRRLGEDRR
jgi:hypothetical protein